MTSISPKEVFNFFKSAGELRIGVGFGYGEYAVDCAANTAFDQTLNAINQKPKKVMILVSGHSNLTAKDVYRAKDVIFRVSSKIRFLQNSNIL